MSDLVNIAIIGAGGWGKNLVRNYYQSPNANLKYICDLDDQLVISLSETYKDVQFTLNYQTILDDESVQAIVIATTATTHFDLAKSAILAGKDVYIEKPFVLNLEEGAELVSLAKNHDQILMVGHLLEYHPVVNKLKEYIQQDEFGDIYYFYCQRLNLGKVRGDENALWSFAPHDISVVLYLLGEEPTEVTSTGQAYLQSGVEDVVFTTLNFNGKSLAHIHVSWLDPHKVRRLTLVGSKKMAVFEDTSANEKLRIYDKGADSNTEYDTYAEYVNLRFGDVTIPHIQMHEPLSIETEHFLNCVKTRQAPLTDGLDGMRVLKVLDAAQKSLNSSGMPIKIEK